eukprot:368710-Amphidinium_carterae.1
MKPSVAATSPISGLTPCQQAEDHFGPVRRKEPADVLTYILHAFPEFGVSWTKGSFGTNKGDKCTGRSKAPLQRSPCVLLLHFN